VLFRVTPKVSADFFYENIYANLLEILLDKTWWYAMDEAIAAMLAASDETGAALERFIEINPEFEDMKAGSRLAGSIGRAADAAKNAKAKMTRFRLECSIAAADTNQLSLTI
jgi:hypothetical protein